jgi:hypothetical protein
VVIKTHETATSAQFRFDFDSDNIRIWKKDGAMTRTNSTDSIQDGQCYSYGDLFSEGTERTFYVQGLEAGNHGVSVTYLLDERELCTEGVSVTFVEIEQVCICNTNNSSSDILNGSQVLLNEQPIRVKTILFPHLKYDLTFACNLLNNLSIRKFNIDINGTKVNYSSVLLNVTENNSDSQANGSVITTVTSADNIYSSLISSSEDALFESCSADSTSAITGASNRGDSDMFDDNISATQRGLARGSGNLITSPPESAISKSFVQAAGISYIDVIVGGVTSLNYQVQEQSDIFYYSGHGNHSSGLLTSILNNESISAADVSDYWNDIDIFVISGCSVLDINDYENHYLGSDHTASPGLEWEATGPNFLLGYNYIAPSDEQNTDQIIEYWCDNRASAGNIDAWKEANNNSNGRNACVIEKSAAYYYFNKITPLWYIWTEVEKGNW